jgi:pSer/pThr/pTyr-binding forkhead associated (FHA) protein
VIAQELLDALNKAQIETNLNPLAVWAFSKYLQGVWKDMLGKSIRPFDLGRAMSSFFVDLSQHRLPEKIWKQTPETEPMLMKFFGTGDGNLAQFWSQCIEIWSVALEPEAVYAKDVKTYFDMLLQSSLQEKRPASHVVTIQASQTPAKPSTTDIPPAASSPAPVELAVNPEQEQVPIPSSEVEPKAPDQPAIPKITSEQKAPAGYAYLVLQGTRVIPLNQPVVKIGRQLDNHIILEDPRVSRTHAQLQLVNDRFVIIDMNSTGGTFINGQRTTQSVLYPGDVISLAGVKFIFSQEMPAKPGTMKIIELGSASAADRPTAVMHKEEVQQAVIAKKNLPELPKTGPLRG